MEIEKAIELLSDHCDRGLTTLYKDFQEAVRMGRNALVHLAFTRGVRWDDSALALLLHTERRKYEPDARD